VNPLDSRFASGRKEKLRPRRQPTQHPVGPEKRNSKKKKKKKGFSTYSGGKKEKAAHEIKNPAQGTSRGGKKRGEPTGFPE